MRTEPSDSLRIVDGLPEGLLEADARALYRILPGPTLIHLPGRRPEPLFVSALLHGNEDVGLLAVQRLLRAYAARELPRALSVFIGNVAAARENVRRLEGQPDFNRIWPGSDTARTPEHAVMQAVVLGGDLEWFNFRELPSGTTFARCNGEPEQCLEVRNEAGEEVSDEFFEREGNLVRLRRPIMPSMLTRDARVVRQDCLCYFMERFPLPE